MMVTDKYYVIYNSADSVLGVSIFDTEAEAVGNFLCYITVDSEDKNLGGKITKAIKSGHYALEDGSWFAWGRVQNCSLLESLLMGNDNNL